MTTSIWTRVMIKSLVLIGSSIVILNYKINNNLFSVDAANGNTYLIPERGPKWNRNWDKRDPNFLLGSGDNTEYDANKVRIPRAKRNIFLIRHGSYNMASGRLTKKGRKQATITGEKLKELGYPYKTTINTSTLTRAIETSELIQEVNPKLKIKKFASLREGFPVDPVPSHHKGYPAKTVCKDGRRIGKAFDEFFHRADARQKQDSFEIVVCHANVIRYFVCRALQFPPERWMQFTLHNCGITWLVIYPDGDVQLKAFGDSQHLPEDLLID